MLKYGVIAVDLDETIMTSKYSYPYVSEVNHKAIGVLNRYRAKGGKIILWTLRTDDHLALALEALAENGLKWDAVNKNVQEKLDEWESKYPGMSCSPKVCCDLFIDDRNYGTHVTGFDWDVIANEILQEVKTDDKSYDNKFDFNDTNDVVTLYGADNER